LWQAVVRAKKAMCRVYNIAFKGKVEGGIEVLDGVNDKKVMIKQLGDSDDEILAARGQCRRQKNRCGWL
jgi:surfactin synthase thioesterase subunit